MEKTKLQYSKHKIPKCLVSVVLFFFTSIFSCQASYSTALSKKIVQTENEYSYEAVSVNKKTVLYQVSLCKKITYILYGYYDKTLRLLIQNCIEKAMYLQRLKTNFLISTIAISCIALFFPEEKFEPASSSNMA
jgi:hypothetical protein